MLCNRVKISIHATAGLNHPKSPGSAATSRASMRGDSRLLGDSMTNHLRMHPQACSRTGNICRPEQYWWKKAYRQTELHKDSTTNILLGSLPATYEQGLLLDRETKK
jgi:hypothetical protein